MKWYIGVLKKYAVFKGRAHRTEFWMFLLMSFIVAFIIGFIDGILGLESNGKGILSSIYSLAIILPALAVGARRLHDTNRSGWWQLIAFVPIIGIIVLIVFWASPGESGKNQYGEAPKPAKKG